MVVPESKDEQTSQSGSVGKSLGQQHKSKQSLAKDSASPQYFNSDETISAANTSLEPREYTETDSLVPNELYSGSRLSGSIKENGTSAPAETVCSMLIQILVPFLLAGLGTVSAGMLLEVVQVRE